MSIVGKSSPSEFGPASQDVMTGKINRLALTAAYKILRRWKWLTKASNRGAGVAVWYQDQILVVRHSYRPGWSLPGGQIKKNEEPRSAASRELREEVGIQTAPESLIPVRQSRPGKFLFECRLQTRPVLKIDNREIIEARFVDPAAISDADDILYPYLRWAKGIDPKNAS